MKGVTSFIIKCIYVFIASFLFLVPSVSANAENIKQNGGNNAVASAGWGLITDYLKKVLINWTNKRPISNNPGAVARSGDVALVRHKSVELGTGTMASVQKEFIGYGRDTIRAVLDKNQIFNPGKVGLITIYWNGHMGVSQGVSHRDFVTFKIPSSTNVKRNMVINYAATKTTQWYPWMEYHKFRDNGDYEPLELSHKEELNRVIKDDKIYVKNSNLEKNAETKKNNFYTMEGLYLEFYDESQSLLTDQPKNLETGDFIYLRDEIVKTKFIPEENTTLFMFESNQQDVEYHEIYFKGDLSNQYDSGDIIKLKSDIITVLNNDNEIFVDLDYNKYVEEYDVIPSIDLYLEND